MAHFAEIGKNINGLSPVLRVLVVADEQEHRGQEFLANDLGLGGTWLQCSYNHNMRGRFPGIGDAYHHALDVFVTPMPEEPAPEGHHWQWHESSQEWLAVELNP